MTLQLADRVKETSTTTGTGAYSLAGAVTGFQTFVAGIGDGNTCYYSATDGTDWEVGLGTVTNGSPDTLARTEILASSNTGSTVDWGAGTRTIFCTLPASIALMAIGFDQTWQDVSGSRSAGTSYQNTTGKPIMVGIRLSNVGGRDMQVSPDNSTWIDVGTAGNSEAVNAYAVVPDGYYYRVQTSYAGMWVELR